METPLKRIATISNLTDLDELLGGRRMAGAQTISADTHGDNELKWELFKALVDAEGRPLAVYVQAFDPTQPATDNKD